MAKISLARAIYSDADIYLFDEILGNIDRKQADSILNNCIKGYLKDKIRILVTHNVFYLNKNDKILYLINGVSRKVMTYDEWKQSNDFKGIKQLKNQYFENFRK